MNKRITRLHNSFETTRKAAYQIHKALGFKDMVTEEKGIHHLIFTKADYLQNKFEL